ncbi:uncharacterized protein LOC108915083 [Anoplophora glabripennis]|uniref:uncharacterized protein LOC108915083 n=1 Tax=Anoplophora glabripennis TaxID=217634 RepID=UPI000C785850|nr:uncharacterized protein LOC108915083 [Anoplophora glabripennis]
MNDPHGSNHLPILIEYQLSGQNNDIINNTHKCWKTDKADWIKYQNHMNTTFAGSYDQMIENINTAAGISIPKINHSRKNNTHSYKPWWNENCHDKVTDRKKAYKIYNENPNLQNLSNYKRLDALAKKTLKETKRQKWKEYCGSLNKNTPIKEVWSKLNQYKNRKKENRMPLNSEAIWIESFHCKLSPPWVNYKTTEINDENTNLDTSVIDSSSHLLKVFTLPELNIALKQHNNTAPGKDNITYSMLAQLPENSKIELLEIYNTIWLLKAPIPSDWYEYIVIPQRKPGKPLEEADSYRPIALASCALKTYERLIKNRLEHWLEKNYLLARFQYGFRRGRSTNEALAILTNDIQISFTNNQSVMATFLDIKGAYDNVLIDRLTIKLNKLGIPPRITLHLRNLYVNRSIYLKINNSITTSRVTSVGLPQGSILSPLLFTIYTMDLETILGKNVKLI